ncbi:hypothetical protein SAMN06265355_108176 [Actinomadura mexicana]|uniref:Uncharacterized protein n=1 Tax=Actinomadura mexicana TaxID=134959 RepID=A0A239A3M3_9ACTN|nr:hypothetical protein SAMN06265355_108176 [Actinomadura mexicana]
MLDGLAVDGLVYLAAWALSGLLLSLAELESNRTKCSVPALIWTGSARVCGSEKHSLFCWGAVAK